MVYEHKIVIHCQTSKLDIVAAQLTLLSQYFRALSSLVIFAFIKLAFVGSIHCVKFIFIIKGCFEDTAKHWCIMGGENFLFKSRLKAHSFGQQFTDNIVNRRKWRTMQNWASKSFIVATKCHKKCTNHCFSAFNIRITCF